MEKLKPYAKAIVAALVAALAVLGTALTDDVITPAEWVLVASSFLGGLGITYAVPNRPAEVDLSE